MAYRYIKKSPQAFIDLEDISIYLLLHASLRTAERFLESAEQTFTKLATMPGMGSHFESPLLNWYPHHDH
ncbi:MAG: type II toxin-antitoxin system RelE/ParE family toxin [Planctomycetia bacterium]|nr:type II toxin-antitoxin system RelE/ParE family toxin [Planctomycetia bacterium]